jgi:hypothetical protein
MINLVVYMLRPSIWFVTGENAVCYDKVYDLLLVRTLYVTTKFMICYWSEHIMLWPSIWFVTGQYTVCYDQVYDLLLGSDQKQIINLVVTYSILTSSKS